MKDCLNPCPFCGGKAEYHECPVDYPTEHKDCYIRCTSCLARIERNTMIEDREMKSRVISLWNRRAEPKTTVIQNGNNNTHIDYVETLIT